MHNIYLSKPSYILGEQSYSVETLPNIKIVLDKHMMPHDSDLWGWGAYRKTSKEIQEFAIEAIKNTFQDIYLDTNEVDAVIFSGGDRAYTYEKQNEIFGSIIAALGISNCFIASVTGSGCVSTSSAILIAKNFICCGIYKNILIVSLDKLDSELERFQRYGVLSDAASAFLVSNKRLNGYILKAIEIASSPNIMKSGETFGEKTSLVNSVHSKLLSKTGSDKLNIDCVLQTNLFKPFVEIELSLLGYSDVFSYFNNINRCGHCFASDFAINLSDLAKSDKRDDIKNDILVTSIAEGHYSMMLLKPDSD